MPWSYEWVADNDRNWSLQDVRTFPMRADFNPSASVTLDDEGIYWAEIYDYDYDPGHGPVGDGFQTLDAARKATEEALKVQQVKRCLDGKKPQAIAD